MKRKAMAMVLSAGLNALDSLRIMTISELLRKHSEHMTTKEQRYLYQRNEIMDDMIQDLRKLQHQWEKS